MKPAKHAVRSVIALLCLFAVLGITAGAPTPSDPSSEPDLRKKAQKLLRDGNYKDAFELYEKLVLNKDTTPGQVGSDLGSAIACLQSINRVNEFDTFLEKVIAVHSNNWRLLQSAAQIYLNTQHQGFIIAGEFRRGHHRGGDGKIVNSYERDRVRALQLMDRALTRAADDPAKAEVANACMEYAHMFMGNRGYNESWRLQYLTDLTQLPDYDEGYYNYYHHRGYGGQTRGAPVDEKGDPVFYTPPAWDTATSDGQRWRWLLWKATQLNPSLTASVLMEFADFQYQQFDVHTMAYYGRFFAGGDEDEAKKDQPQTWALHTLGDNETIARLATGVKRFNLPDEFNYITLYRKIADIPHCGYNEQAVNRLAEIFQNRRQYEKAVDCWRESIKKYGPGQHEWKQKKIDQILNNWGQFEPVMTHPAGQEASVEFRFRNATRVNFEAHAINVKALLSDLKDYLKSNPRELDWQKMNIHDIGYRMVTDNGKKYVGEKKAGWSLDLKPRPLHFDRRITVKTPLKDPGAYLLTATLPDGNVSRIVIWLDDTVIVRKQLDKNVLFFVADAVTGKPLPKANVEFFGYRTEGVKWEKVIGRHYNVLTTAFAEFTDADGQLMPAQKDFTQNYQWLITATADSGRQAFLGFSHVWYGNYYDQEYNATKVFMISDRPVYRPNQPVKFKFWVRHAKYDEEDSSSFANQSFQVQIHNPKGEKIFEKNFTADAYGGFDGELTLPKDATLGVYSANIHGLGGGTFRLEEYKKPEFEVKVDAPSEPVMLGEKIPVKIAAKYYFGAPVTQAKIKYKVLRSAHTARWYPYGIWDWFYGPGYWWFAYDYHWYPGWKEWGCRRPHFWWWPAQPVPPEIVAEGEREIGADGTFKLDLDTALAKAMHGDTDHRYEVTAEVTDQSRRTIVGAGTILVARKPFQVTAWVDRGHYRVKDVIQADFMAQTLDHKPVKGKGSLTLYQVAYGKDGEPEEKVVQKWSLDTDETGRAAQQITASKAGQYRLSYKVTDEKKHTIEGAHLFCIMGDESDKKNFRFNDIELVPDRKEYAAGDKVRLRINTDRQDGTVLLFVRPANGICLAPEVIRLKGKSAVREIEVTRKDMPNFFVEALTVSNGKVHSEMREIVVPPEKRIINLAVTPSAEKYKPGEMAKVKIRLTDLAGKPFVGSTVVSVYDKSVEYISGGSNVPEIKEFFWKWRRHHHPQTESSLGRSFYNLVFPNTIAMQSLGVFGDMIADEAGIEGKRSKGKMAAPGRAMAKSAMRESARMELSADAAPASAPMLAAESLSVVNGYAMKDEAGAGAAGGGVPEPVGTVQPTVRKDFADTAFWKAALLTDAKGEAEVEFKMPENLTGWKIRTWAMGHGTKVGEATAEVVTTKNLLLRLQAPRFFVEKDEVVLSANIHNYLSKKKTVKAVLELDGKCLQILGDAGQSVAVDASGEKRVDWRVKVVKEGEAVIRMKALTDEESDAMQMKFPVYVHGMLKTDSFCGVIRRNADKASVTYTVPKERRIDESVLEIRYSPTLAGAMVDALPYLVEYPYGCTEQTLNKFLPTVITQKILKDMGLDLKAVKDKKSNLNAQEIGDDKKRGEDWKRLAGDYRWDGEHWVPRNPIFDEAAVNDMVKEGVRRLTAMQLSDGGWGWFSDYGEHSYPHTTAYVVHGLQVARQNGVALVPGVLERGIEWLANYEKEQVRLLKNAEAKKSGTHWKTSADNLDAFVYMVLADAGKQNADMREFLYRDRLHLAVYGKAMYGMALFRQEHQDKLAMIMQNIEQFLVEDKENQTAYLNLGNEGYWWYWYGSEYEAHAYYLKLLALTAPKSDKAAGLVKYLLNNRRHATYWNSTRDTALCIEALADYLRASGEDKPDMTLEVLVDGKKVKEVKIDASNLFTFDNKFVMIGDAVESGKHTVEIRRKGTGPVYFNAYLTNFTLEDFITRAGLEIKVNRKVYKLTAVDKTIKVAGSRGQALDQKVEKYRRDELANLAELKSGDLVEVELEIDSKNDYEYIVFEDMKAAGFEPVEVRSGYNGNDMGAYVEFRDERVCFFVRALARGKHSVAYRLRAEIPGTFSALPTKASAMYAPELKANSDEIKLKISD